jgi:hypothetical protein
MQVSMTAIDKTLLTVTLASLLVCGQQISHGQTSAEAKAASELLNHFETVVYAKSAFLLDTRKATSDTIDSVADLRAPFLELTEGLKSLGPDTDLHLEQNSTAVILGAEDFSPPRGIGPVTSRRSYVLVLSPEGLVNITSDFGRVPRVMVEGSQAWTWTTPPLDGDCE